jgi:hypothetical protein
MKLALQYLIVYTLALQAVFVPSAYSQSKIAAPDYSFAIANQSPLTILYGVPRYHETSLTQAGLSQWDVSFDISNNFTGSSTGSEFLRIDGENTRLGLRYLRGFRNGWELGAELAIMHHGGGKLDSVITNFHDLFGFGQMGRDRIAKNQLNYQYTVDGVDQIQFNQTATGIGDFSFLLAKQVRANSDSQTSVRAQLKLPTGNSTKFFGSGATDVNLGVHHSAAINQNWAWQLYGNIAYLGTGEILPSQQKNTVLSAGVGLNWQAFERVSFRVQWDAHTSVYKRSNLGQFRKDAYLISFGGRISLNKLGYLDLAITEDAPNPEASPDVSFYVNWRLPINPP